MSETIEVKVPMKVGTTRFRETLTITQADGRLYLKFKYNKPFTAEVKEMEGRKWHGFDEHNPRKIWSVKDSPRNWFQIRVWEYEALDPEVRRAHPELNPYHRYDLPLIDTIKFERPVRDHQKEFVRFILTRKYCELAAEMGTGKTLAWIEAAERALAVYRNVTGDYDTPDRALLWYVGPKAGVVAVSRELKKWNAKFDPLMVTYEGLVKVINEWRPEQMAPIFVCFDEASRIKTPQAQRSKAAKYLADSIRMEWNELGYVLLMTGTPAPKSPVDWWHQCEVACPGFLKEGDIEKFKRRLCLIENRESISGGIYPHIVTWLDDDKKCAICGQLKDAANHDVLFSMGDAKNIHNFVPSKNEVEYLYKRLQGLVLVSFKKDCTSLPEKQYELVQLKPTIEMVRAAKLLKASSARAIQALNLLRELADGFQYSKQETNEMVTCQNCHGTGKDKVMMPTETFDILAPLAETNFVEEEIDCENCYGEGKVPVIARITNETFTPKDEYFRNELEENEETGRYVVWGGFTATIDRICKMALKENWYVLRVDGRGYVGFDPKGGAVDYTELLDAMDRSNPKFKEYRDKYPKVCFVGHPKAGGMALTLTASPVALYYSNCFDGEARFQSEDRCHRLGMDENRGYLIKDLIVLPSDQLVLDNLRKKRKLQDLTMGELDLALAAAEDDRLF